MLRADTPAVSHTVDAQTHRVALKCVLGSLAKLYAYLPRGLRDSVPKAPI